MSGLRSDLVFGPQRNGDFRPVTKFNNDGFILAQFGGNNLFANSRAKFVSIGWFAKMKCAVIKFQRRKHESGQRWAIKMELYIILDELD